MAFPQFTGEASLYRSTNQYSSATPVGALAQGLASPQGSVLPDASAILQPALTARGICAHCKQYPDSCTYGERCQCGGGFYTGGACF
jgi:hypothetical protein